MAKQSNPQRYVAFLRAINVGGHTVKMDRLRALFAEMGFAAVETFIASGNVIFDVDGGEDARVMEGRIERHLREALGYEVATFLRTTAEVDAVARNRPFAEGEGEGVTLFVGFLHDAPGDEGVRKLMAFRTEEDDFAVHGREVYWLRRGRSSDSDFSGARMEKALGMPGTLRNVNTVRKLAAKYPPLSS